MILSKKTLNSYLTAITLSSLATISVAHADQTTNSKEIANMLGEGGYIIYMRHASTERDYADQVTADVNNCSTQRTLSEKGWDEATLIGAAVDVLKIPVGSIYSSEYCRAWKTARLAFGTPVKLSGLNFEKSEEYSDTQIETMRKNVEPLLTQTPLTGTNTIIVGHDDPFEAVTGIYPEPQGVAYVVKPSSGGKFEVMGSIKPTDWLDILAAQ